MFRKWEFELQVNVLKNFLRIAGESKLAQFYDASLKQ